MKMTLDEEIKRISEGVDTETESKDKDFKPVSEEDMANFQTEIDEKSIDLRPENELEYEIPKTNKKKKRKKKNRTVEIHARVTPEEAEKIRRDMESVRMRPGEYVRHRLLGDVDFIVADSDLLAEYTRASLLLKAELGKVGGLLKLCVIKNKENPLCTEEDLKEIMSMVKRLARLEGQIQRAVNRKWQS